MKMRKWLAAASLCLAIAVPQAARAVSTTNLTDQWYIQAETGWGAAVLQQGSILFIDLFVYGQDGKPTWFVAAATFQGATAQGHLVFTGDLYTATGPWFGGPFNPANVNGRKVGTLTFEGTSLNAATISYTVDGVPVSKNTVRQTWAIENIGGSYYGGMILDYTTCTPASMNGHVEQFGAFQISQGANNNVTMSFQFQNGTTCTYTGTYGQTGHMGNVTGTFTCSDGATGSFAAFELEANLSGLTGRMQGQSQFCKFNGTMGGLLR